MKYKIALSAIVFLCVVLTCFADDNEPTVKPENLLPTELRPIEPTMASLGKYGVYDVSLFNGLPQISFTLFEVKAGSLVQPIVLSYHGGGIKVNEDAGWVGLGWDLSYGGSITRNVHGKLDEEEDFSNVPTASGIMDIINADPADVDNPYLDALAGGESYSYRQDVYHFTAGGQSGMYVFDNNNKYMTIPKMPIKVTEARLPYDKSIVFPNGTVYNYIDCDRTTPSKTSPYTSSWSIKNITSADGGSSINYTYQQDGTIYIHNKSYYDGYKLTEVTGGSPTYTRLGLQSSSSPIYVESQKPATITFDGGKLEFNLTGRYDILQRPDGTPLKKLDNIKIYKLDEDGLYAWIKTIQFHYSYFGSTGDPSLQSPSDLRLKLDSVEEKTVNGETHLIAGVTYHDGLPAKYSFSTDHWGYYNASDNLTPIPNFSYGYIYVDGAIKTCDETAMKAGSLKEITYPTGGKTVFNWETNDTYTDEVLLLGTSAGSISLQSNETYNYNNLDHGYTLEELELLAIEDPIQGRVYEKFTVNTTQTVQLSYYLYRQSNNNTHEKYDQGKLFIYDVNTGSNVFEKSSLSYPSTTTATLTLEEGHTYRAEIRLNCINVKASLVFDYTNLPQYANCAVGGLRVESIVNYDSEGTFLTKKRYEYKKPGTQQSSGFLKTDLQDILYSNSTKTYAATGLECTRTMTQTTLFYSTAITGIYSSPVCYRYVQEYNSDSGGETSGYTAYTFATGKDYIPAKDIHISKEWNRGQLLNRKMYKNDGNETYECVLDEINNYSTEENFKSVSNGFKLYRLIPSYLCSCEDCDNPYITLEVMYEPVNYSYIAEWKHLDSTVTKTYESGKEVVRTVNYHYDNTAHMQVSRITETNSDNMLVCTQILYPPDYAGGLTELVNANILNKPVEVVKYKTNLYGSAERIIDGKIITYKTGGQVGLVDKMFILENAVPIGKASFQLSSKTDVNALLPGEGTQAPFSLNGIDPQYSTIPEIAYKYSVSNKIIEYTKRNEDTVSIVWGYNNTRPVLTVKGISRADLETDYALILSYLGNETNLPYASCKYNQISLKIENIKEAISSLSGNNYMYAIHTYSPLVGMTSVTDPNGITSYYEYDDFGRLKCTRDDAGNITNTYKYHYAGEGQ